MYTPKLSPKEMKALLFIRDEITYRGKSPSYRKIKEHVGYSSPRSAYLVVDRLIHKGYLQKTSKGNLSLVKDVGKQAQTERTIEIPLVGSAPCGLPLLAEENIETTIPVSQRIAKPGATYFLLHAVGDSMDKAGINDGDLVLVRQQPVADDRQRVVALIDDEATIKEIRRKGGTVVLFPQSSNPIHKPIILDKDFLIQGIVIEAIPNPLE